LSNTCRGNINIFNCLPAGRVNQAINLESWTRVLKKTNVRDFSFYSGVARVPVRIGFDAVTKWRNIASLRYERCRQSTTMNIKACSCNHCCSGKEIIIAYCEYMCNLSYPACNAHAPYCHLWPVRFYSMFTQYFINARFYIRKRLLSTKRVFWFSL
jgi:hypothetical protein